MAPATRPNARYTPLDAPGPLPVDMVRAVPAIRRDPIAFLAGLVERHGDAVAFPWPGRPVLLANSPAAARHVLVDNARGYTKETVQYGALSLVTGAGLLTADGPTWRTHRRLAQPAFHHGRLDGVAAASLGAARRLRAAFDAAGPDVPVDVDEQALRATLGVVGHVLVAQDLEDVGQRVVDAVDEALRAVVRRAQSPVPARVPTPGRRRMRRAVAHLDAVAADVVARRRARGVGDDDADLLGLLLRADLTDAEVRDELVTAVIAGHETVASNLTWTLHLLAGRPDVQAWLHAELDAVLDGREPAWDDLRALVRTRAVVEEALRLYPPAWVITRRATADDVVDGLAVPAGPLGLLSPWLLHRRADSWPDPLDFRPERFLDAGGPARGDYVPFGAGPRLCIGRDFALVEATVVLAALLRDRTVARPPGAPEPVVDALVTLRPRGGLPLLLTPR